MNSEKLDLSGRREDYKILKFLADCGEDGYKKVKGLSQLPLLVIPDKNVFYEDFDHDDNVDGNLRFLDNTSNPNLYIDSTFMEIRECLPYQFVLYETHLQFLIHTLVIDPSELTDYEIENLDVDGLDVVDKLIDFYIYRFNTKKSLICYNATFCKFKQSNDWSLSHPYMRVFVKHKNQILISTQNGRIIPAIYDSEEMRTLMEDGLSFGFRYLKLLSKFVEYVKQKDYYFVEKRAVNPEKRPVNTIYRSKNLPRLIYMNRLPMPSDKKEHQGGTHAAPRRHERKGHYRTLKADRFKYHPKYGVENGIYIRPTWVGDKEVVVEGNRYTVIVKD